MDEEYEYTTRNQLIDSYYLFLKDSNLSDRKPTREDINNAIELIYEDTKLDRALIREVIEDYEKDDEDDEDSIS
jgi:hypothetical protein